MENKNERNEEIVEMESELAAFIRSTKMRRSPQRPAKDATRAEIPDETSGRADGEKDSESDAAPATQIGTQTIQHSAVIGERGTVETAETNKMVSNISRVGGLSITLAQAEEERLIKKCTAIVKHMRSSTFLQKNVGKGVKNGLMELEELLDRISYYRRTWKVRQNPQEAETTALPEENTTSTKRIADSPLQSELGKKRKEEGTSEGDFTQVLSRAEKKKAKRIKRQQHVAPSEKPLPKTKADTKDGVPKEKVGRRRRTRPPALLIKPTEGKTFAEVLSEIRYKIKPEDNGAEVSSIRKTKGGGVLVELGPKTINKVTFCEAVKGLLGEKALVSSLEPTCALEIRDLDCLTEKNEVEEAIKRECPEVTNVRIGITSANSRGQKLAVVEVAEQYARKLLNSGKIRIGWVVCRIRIRAAPTKCYRCLDYGHTSANCRGPDRRATCRKCGQAGHKANSCNEKESCVLCRDRGATDESIAHTAGSGRCPVFRAELERARIRST